MNQFCQVSIVILSCSAIWLVSRREKWRRWGYILGMSSQPFWFWATIESRQWGMVLISIWYTYAWAQGIWNYWISPEKPTGIKPIKDPLTRRSNENP